MPDALGPGVTGVQGGTYYCRLENRPVGEIQGNENQQDLVCFFIPDGATGNNESYSVPHDDLPAPVSPAVVQTLPPEALIHEVLAFSLRRQLETPFVEGTIASELDPTPERWRNPPGVLKDDFTEAIISPAATESTKILVQGFNFELPEDARIEEITIEVTHAVFGEPTDITDEKVYLFACGFVGDFGFSHTVTADVVTSNASFGRAVDVSDDGQWMVVTRAGGYVYFFERVDDVFVFRQVILHDTDLNGTPANPGCSVSISGDGAVVAVGDNMFDLTGYFEHGHGAVYIFRRTGNTWAYAETICDPSPQSNPSDPSGDRIRGTGNSVSLNYDGSVLIAGAPSNVLGFVGYGTVRVYTYGVGWGAPANIYSPNAHNLSAHAFGRQVSVSDDGDKIAIAANIGSYVYDASSLVEEMAVTSVGDATMSGDGLTMAFVTNTAAFIYTRSGLSWVQEATFSGAFAGVNGDMSLSEDGSMLVITNSTTQTMYIYSRLNGLWGLDSTLQPSDIQTSPHSGRYGLAARLSGDKRTAVVASDWFNTSALTKAGKVYVYTR